MYEWTRNKENTESVKLMADKVSGDGDCRIDIHYCEGSQSWAGEFSWDNHEPIICEDTGEEIQIEEDPNPVAIDMDTAESIEDAERIADKWIANGFKD